MLVLAFLTGSLAPVVIALTPGTASATSCGTAIPAGSSCTLTGTLSLTGGSLTLTTPSSLSWADTLNGFDQSVADTVAGDEQYTVNDATGTGAGWHVTMSATTFANGSHRLADTGTLVACTTSSITGTTAPTDTCGSGSTCTLPTDSTTYPVAITTAGTSPSPFVIYDTAANTGLGEVVIGGSTQADPVGWWLNIPANTYYGSAGVYTSTITMEVVSAP
jgi:WxL domain surface cell wall-binding